MKHGSIGLLALGLAAPALAQIAPPPAPSPVEVGRAAGEATAAQAQADQQARFRAQAAAARRRNEAATQPVFTAPPDDGRARSTGASFDQTIGPKSDATTTPAPSPYGEYYRIRTPWER